MTIQQRFTATTLSFFKKLRNTGLTVLTIAGTVASSMSQATSEAAANHPKKKNGNPLSVFSAFLNHCRNVLRYALIGSIVYPHSLLTSFRSSGKLKRISAPEMDQSTVSAAEEKPGINRRYQFSIEELFLIP